MYTENFRYDKGLGNSAIYAKLLYDGAFWNFVNKVKSEIETDDCKVFLGEIVGSSDERGWYSASFRIPDGGPYAIEICLTSGEKIGDDIAEGRPVGSPTIEPISISDVEGQVRIDNLSAETQTVNRFIFAIREKGEAVTRRALVEKQLTLTLDAFPSGRLPIEIPYPPLKSIDSITYIDSNGVEQTLDLLLIRTIFSKTEPEMCSFIMPIYGFNWPTALQDLAVVNINFTCGYTPETCPEAIKQWILLNVSNLYENRETTVIGNRINSVDISTLADSLIESYRIPRL